MYNSNKETNKKGGTRAKIFGISFFSSSKAQLLREVEGVFDKKSGKCLIYTPNPEIVVESMENKALSKALSGATFNIADGIGVVWASRILAIRSGRRVRIGERIAGADLAEDLVQICGKKGIRVMFLGGKVGVAAAAAKQMEKRYKSLPIMATPGYEDVKHPTKAEEAAVIEMVEKTKPGLLLVAFGQGKQESWLDAHSSLPFVLGMGVGGTLDFWAGRSRRASKIWRRMGLEWLWRLLREPWRWRRQLKLLKFVALVLSEFIS